MVRAPGSSSTSDEAGTTPAVRRRPKDRRRRIVAAAAEQFAEVGFHDVSMASIAEAVGITASALYRHFDGKQNLLRAAIFEAFDRFEETINAATNAEELLRRTVDTTIEHRELSTLWQREARHLDEDDQRRIRQLMRDVHGRLVGALADEHPDTSTDELDLRVWAIQSVHSSLGRYHVRLPTEPLAALVHAIGESVRRADLSRIATGSPDPIPPILRPPGALAPASRREALLAATIELVHARGYRAVSLDELGAATGIAGPSIYNHFPTKAAILVAAFRRGTEALSLTLDHVLRGTTSPDQALGRLVRAYTRIVLEHTALFGLLVTEALHLPPEDRDELRRMQHDHVAEWIALVRAARPEVSEDEAGVLVHAALTLVGDLSRTPHLRERPRLEQEIVVLVEDVLTTELLV